LRAFLSLLLVGLLTACPLLCRAAETGCSADHGRGAGESKGERPAPACPDDGVCCVCAGAVHAAESRVPAPVLGDLNPPWDLPPATAFGRLSLDRFASRTTCKGTPSGFAGWADALGVRALLQNFRC
jgi:hypothetical protein